MKVLAVFNLKGGVGKTSTAVNLACAAGQSNIPTLVWDLDAQGAAGFYLSEKNLKPKVKSLLREEIPIGRVIKQTAYPWVDLIPAAFSNRNMDVLLSERGASEELIRRLIAPLAESYRLLIFDCPPSLSRLSGQVFKASHNILMPVVPAPLSLRACEQVTVYLRKNGVKRKKLMSFFSMVDRRRFLHKQWLAKTPKEMPNPLSTYIPYASAVERMGVSRIPLVADQENHPISLRYRALWDEIAERIKV